MVITAAGDFTENFLLDLDKVRHFARPLITSNVFERFKSLVFFTVSLLMFFRSF